MNPPMPERISTPASAKPMIAQTGKFAVLAATGAAAGVSGALFAVVDEVVVRELVVVGAVVATRVEVEVVGRRFFGGATAWPLVVV
jgi:hypothetical protein